MCFCDSCEEEQIPQQYQDEYEQALAETEQQDQDQRQDDQMREMPDEDSDIPNGDVIKDDRDYCDDSLFCVGDPTQDEESQPEDQQDEQIDNQQDSKPEDQKDQQDTDVITTNDTSVNPDLFLTDSGNVSVEEVSCTLSEGTLTTCYQIVSNHQASDHQMGPLLMRIVQI